MKFQQLFRKDTEPSQVPLPNNVEQREGGRVGGLLGHAVPRIRHGQQREGLHRHEVHQGNGVRLREGRHGERGLDGRTRVHFSRRLRNQRCHGGLSFDNK